MGIGLYYAGRSNLLPKKKKTKPKNRVEASRDLPTTPDAKVKIIKKKTVRIEDTKPAA